MSVRNCGVLCALLFAASLLASSQNNLLRGHADALNMPTPHEPTPRLAVKMDPAQLKLESDELLYLAESVPADVDKESKGILAQHLKDRLKRIEKLSKELQKQIP
jgi:hypothetical protein